MVLGKSISPLLSWRRFYYCLRSQWSHFRWLYSPCLVRVPATHWLVGVVRSTFSHTNSKPNHHINSGMWLWPTWALIALFIGNFWCDATIGDSNNIRCTTQSKILSLISYSILINIEVIPARLSLLPGWFMYFLNQAWRFRSFLHQILIGYRWWILDVDSGTLLPTFILTILKGIK